MDGYDLEMTQVIHAPEESEDEDDNREVQAVLKVQLEDTPARFQTFTLKPGVNIVGRSHSCDIRIDIPAVSKQHAQIELGKSDIIIADLGSQNGVKIGKRTLQPRIMYTLDYNKEFFVAGLKAWVLRDEENGAGGDTDSDTCSESLLTAAEIAQDQAGAETQAAASETSTVACDSADGPGNVASVLGPRTHSAVNNATTPSQDANACNSTTQSSGSFTLPEMPNLDFTQTGSSEEMEACKGDREAKSGIAAAEVAVPVTSIGGGSEAVATDDKDAFLCATAQGFPDSSPEGKPGDASALSAANTTLQPYGNNAGHLEASCSRHNEIAGVEADEEGVLNAPTQGFGDAAALITGTEGHPTAAVQPSADGMEYSEAHFSALDEVTEAANEVDPLNAPTQGFASDSITLLDVSDEENNLNAATQPYADGAECSEAPRSTRNEVANAEADEMHRFNAPTQGFGDATQPYADDAEYSEAPRSNHNEVANAETDEMDRFNAPTQGFGDATQPYVDDAECSKAPRPNQNEVANAEVDEMDRFNAPTQGFGDDTAEDLSAPILAPAACTSLDEQERLNAVTQSIDDHRHAEADTKDNFCAPTQPGDRPQCPLSGPCDLSSVDDSNAEADTEDNFCAPTQPGDRPRRLLSGPCDLSFVLCEASQPCRDDEEDEYCPPTQKDHSPALKVHALLKHGKEKHQAPIGGEDDNDETPPLSPKTTVDETPPPSPGYVAESDPEDNNVSMVTARHSLSALNASDATLYEDCATPGGTVGSPVIGIFGRVSAKRPRSGMSLRKKPPCDIGVELPGQEMAAGTEYQQESVSSKASRKLDYTEQAQAGDGSGSSTAESRRTSTVTWLEKDAQESSKHAKGRSSTASIDPSEKDDSAPYLHMSEIEGLDVPATEEVSSSGPHQRSATFEETGKAAEGHAESDKVVDNSASREEMSKKEESAEASSDIEEETKTASRRNRRGKQTVSKTSRTRKQAGESDVGDSTAEAGGAPARRSSSRQNAGSRMKSLLSLEKRTSASGDFREGGLSQEVSDKQDALQDGAEKAQDKVTKRGSRHGQKDKGAARDEQEMAPSPPPPRLMPSPDASTANFESSWHEKDVEESVLKSGNLRSMVAEGNGEHVLKEAPVVVSEDEHVEDRVEAPSSPLLECKLDCTNAIIETGFSEPFTSFSQILADCQAAAEVGKAEQVEAQRRTAADMTAMDEDEATSSSVHSEQESVTERHHQASRSTENANDGTVTRKRKEQAAQKSLTRRKATRGSVGESSRRPAEVLVEDTPRDVEESEAVQSPAQQRSTRAAKRGHLSRNKAIKKAVSEFEVLSTIPETEQPEGGSEVDSLSAQPLEDVGEKLLEAPETRLPSQEDGTASHPQSSKASRRDVKRTKAGSTKEEEQKGATATQPGRRDTRTCPTQQDSDSQNEGTLEASLKIDVESIESLSPRASQRGRKGERLSQSGKALAKDCEQFPTQPVSSQPEHEAGRGVSRRRKADDAVAESTLANSCTETEFQDSKTSRRRGKAATSSQDKGGKTVISAEANVAEESCVEHELEESARNLRRGRNTRLPPKKRGLPVTDTLAESALGSGSTKVKGEGALPQSGRTSARLSRKQHSEESPEADLVKESPRTPEPQTTRSSQRKRAASHSRDSKAPSEQTAAAGPAKRPLKTEPTSPRTNSQPSSASTRQGQSQETLRQGKKNVAKVPAKAKQEIADSELELSPKPTSEPPKARPSRRQASKMPTLAAQAPVTRKRDAERVGKQESAPSTSAASTVETLEEEASLLCSPPKAARKKRPVASMSFGESRQESDDDETTGKEEQTLEEMQIKSEPKSRRKEPVKEPAVTQEIIKEPPAKRGKRKGNLLPDVVPVEPRRSRAQEGRNMGASPQSTPMTLKRKPKILFTGIDCTDEEEQVVRELGGAVATTASACTHLVTDKFRRTVKSLCCIAKGTPIVDVSWIKKCQEENVFVDHAPFLLQDRKAEKSLSFSLSETLAQAVAHGGVLRGWSIHATARVQPSPRDMKEIVTCAGGKYLDAMPTRSTTSGNTVIVSCKEDSKACTRAKNNGVPIVSAEFVLSGLLQYKVDIDTHHLG